VSLAVLMRSLAAPSSVLVSFAAAPSAAVP